MSKIYYVTKYALTRGILEIPEAHIGGVDGDGWIWIREQSWPFDSWPANPNEWFKTRVEAEADKRRRAAKKIASLRMQIAKLEKLAAPASSEKEGRDSFNSFGYDATSPEAGAGFRDEERDSDG